VGDDIAESISAHWHVCDIAFVLGDVLSDERSGNYPLFSEYLAFWCNSEVTDSQK